MVKFYGILLVCTKSIILDENAHRVTEGRICSCSVHGVVFFFGIFLVFSSRHCLFYWWNFEANSRPRAPTALAISRFCAAAGRQGLCLVPPRFTKGFALPFTLICSPPPSLTEYKWLNNLWRHTSVPRGWQHSRQNPSSAAWGNWGRRRSRKTGPLPRKARRSVHVHHSDFSSCDFALFGKIIFRYLLFVTGLPTPW